MIIAQNFGCKNKRKVSILDKVRIGKLFCILLVARDAVRAVTAVADVITATFIGAERVIYEFNIARIDSISHINPKIDIVSNMTKAIAKPIPNDAKHVICV